MGSLLRRSSTSPLDGPRVPPTEVVQTNLRDGRGRLSQGAGHAKSNRLARVLSLAFLGDHRGPFTYAQGQDIKDPEFKALNALHNMKSKAVDEIIRKTETRTIREVVRVLTPQQRKALEKMKGEPYDLSRLTWDYANRTREEKAAKERKAASEETPN